MTSIQPGCAVSAVTLLLGREVESQAVYKGYNIYIYSTADEYSAQMDGNFRKLTLLFLSAESIVLAYLPCIWSLCQLYHTSESFPSRRFHFHMSDGLSRAVVICEYL